MKRLPALVVCMGVSGCGKTTVARAIADATGLACFEADDFHSEENRARMAAGKPLDDAMREPWIASLCEALVAERQAGRSCVLACSALRRAHRDRFRAVGFRTCFLFLDGERELIARWMSERKGHFMPPGLLDSQFETLESPLGEEDAIRIDLAEGWPAVEKSAIGLTRNFLSR